MNVMSIITIVVTACCFAWLIGVLIFALVKKIIIKVKAKKEQNLIVEEHEKEKGRFYGTEKRAKKSK